MIGSNSKFKKNWIERCCHLCVCPLIDHRGEPIGMRELIGLLYNWCSFTLICTLFQIVQQRMSRQTMEKESSSWGGTSTDKLGRDNCFSTYWGARSDRRWQGLGWAYCKLQYKNFVYHYLVGAGVRVSIRKTLCDIYTTWKGSHYVSVPDNLSTEHNDSTSSSSQKICTNSNNVCLAA